MLKTKARQAGHRITAGEDKAYDTVDHVANLRAINVTPHVTQNNGITKTGKSRRSAIDERTTRHQGYGMSQTRRAMIECIFGWGKQHGTMRKTKHRGIGRVTADFLLSDLRTEITALGLTYVAGILSSTTVWAPGTGPLPPKLMRRNRQHQPVAVKALAQGLPAKAWRTITWRQGTNEKLTSRFARVRVRAAHRDCWQTTQRSEEWLLIEWPKGENEPTKYWLSTLPEDVAFQTLVDMAKLRWRIERDYQELKQEVGLGHFEGRGWRGFHHHATMCIAAYGFLISERETIPPSATQRARPIPITPVPADYRPRGSAAADPTSHSKFDRDDATAARTGARADAIEMLLLCDQVRLPPTAPFVTQ